MTYADRHGVCSSWHRAPEGWHTWQGHWSGYSKRPFCRLKRGHYGDHEAYIERIGSHTGRQKRMAWPQRRLPGETGHQFALRTVEGYALDSEGHAKECVLRFPDCIEAGCENDSGCISDLPDESGALFHECGAPEHLT